jgi:hypothetical protein
MDVPLKCACGKLKGIAKDLSPVQGRRIVCLCDDCQAFALYLGQAKLVLDQNGGTEILQMLPANLEITHGIENLKCLRLSDKGMLRWYAGCCNIPIANTAPYSKMPYTGVVHSILDFAGDARSREASLGPVRARIQGKFGIGNLPEGTHQKVPPGLILRIMGFLISGLLRGKYAPSPFFNRQTGKPTVEPYILSANEREALRKLCGPSPSKI